MYSDELLVNSIVSGEKMPPIKDIDQDNRLLILASLHELSQALKKEFGDYHA